MTRYLTTNKYTQKTTNATTPFCASKIMQCPLSGRNETSSENYLKKRPWKQIVYIPSPPLLFLPVPKNKDYFYNDISERNKLRTLHETLKQRRPLPSHRRFLLDGKLRNVYSVPYTCHIFSTFFFSIIYWTTITDNSFRPSYPTHVRQTAERHTLSAWTMVN